MPELPEVETIARGLAKRVTGDVIESVWLGQKKEPLKSPASEMAATLEHARITTVRRMGKHIVFDLDQENVGRTLLSAKGRRADRKPKEQAVGRTANSSAPQAKADKSVRPTNSKAQWIVHLGMTGRLQVCEPDAEVAKHTHAILKLKSGRELRFVDPRRFGRLSVAQAGGFAATGIEPLEVDLDRFLTLFRGRKTPIKSALLNQNLLRGVGNIYADESLFRARHPPPPPCLYHHSRPTRKTSPCHPRSPERSHCPRRLLHLRLRRRRRRRRILPAPAPRLRPRRRTLPRLQNANQTNRNRRPQQPLLPEVPEVKLLNADL